MTPCPFCGSFQNRATSKYCSDCGALLLPPTKLSCPHRSMQNPPDAKFCINCAYALTPSGQVTTFDGMLPTNQILQERYVIVYRVGGGGMGKSGARDG